MFHNFPKKEKPTKTYKNLQKYTLALSHPAFFAPCLFSVPSHFIIPLYPSALLYNNQKSRNE